MAEKSFDLAILGGGPAGCAAALQAARMGGRVLLVEQGDLGGTCLNRGCIPTKTLAHGVGVFQAALQAVQWGVRGCRPEMDMAVLLGRKAEVMAGLRQGLAASLARSKVTVLRGLGRVPALGSVAVRTEAGESLHAARNILLCLGSEPSIPPIPGIGQPGVMTSDQILDLDRVPRSLIIIGAGVIGLEFAGIYSGLGSTVTVLEAAPRILPMLDSDLTGRLLPLWKRQGVRLERGVSVSSIERGDGGGFLVRANGPAGPVEIAGDAVLAAVGRRPRSLSGVVDLPGLAMDCRCVAVDAGMRTSLPGIYAAGDLTSGPMLAHAASAEGLVAAENAMGGDAAMDYTVIPSCVYTTPEIAWVGLGEDEARRKGLNPAVGRSLYGANGRAQTLGEPLGMVKLVAEEGEGRLLGAQLFGAQASELVATTALAVKNGLTARQLARTVHSHPTLSETLAEAAFALTGGALHAA